MRAILAMAFQPMVTSLVSFVSCRVYFEFQSAWYSISSPDECPSCASTARRTYRVGVGRTIAVCGLSPPRAVPGPDRISSMLIGSRTNLGRDFFFGFISRLDMQELHQPGAGHPVIVRRFAVRIHVHQELARALGFGNRAVGPDGRKHGNPVLL